VSGPGDWVALARLMKPRGRVGELAAISLSSFPERFPELGEVYLFAPRPERPAGRTHSASGGSGDRRWNQSTVNPSLTGEPVQGQPFRVEHVWEHRGRWIFKFAGIDSISQAEPWRGAEVRIPRQQRHPLAEGEYYLADLVGLQVLDDRTGERLGVVEGWQESAGSVVLEVAGETGGFLLPFARSMLERIDVAGGSIRISPPEGLVELNRK